MRPLPNRRPLQDIVNRPITRPRRSAGARSWTTVIAIELAARLAAEPVAVQDDRAVVRLQVNYLTLESQEYRDLWLLTFAADGRVSHFEEWAYWPGHPYTARP